MAYQCVHCAKTYDDGSREILQGCSCGSKFFFYLTAEKLAKINQVPTPAATIPLSDEEKVQIEHDVREIIGMEESEEAPVVLDFESVKILKPGKYIIDLHNLFNNERPLVYTLEEGKYFVDLGPQVSSRPRSEKK